MYQISVACGCDIGRVRARNEDNIYLNGRTLELGNDYTVTASAAAMANAGEYLLTVAAASCLAVFVCGLLV